MRAQSLRNAGENCRSMRACAGPPASEVLWMRLLLTNITEPSVSA